MKTTEQRLESIEKQLADINIFIKDGIIEPSNAKDIPKMIADIQARILKLEEKVYDLPPRKYNPAHELNPETTKKLRDLFNKMLHTPKTTGPGIDLVHENGPEVIQTPNGRVMAATWHKIDDEGLAALSNMADMSMQDAITREGGPLPEFTTQRDWEVLEFRREGGDRWKLDSGEYLLVGIRWTLDEMLNKVEGARIHSVRRTTDGQVFTVGDRITIGTIDSFQVIDSFIRVRSGNSSTPLNAACKEDPIFTTADGVEIYDPMKIVYYHWKNGKIGMRYAQDLIGSTAYSTWEAAQVAYKKWLQSQRVLTLGDVLECDGDIAKLEEIVKTRL